MTSIDRQQAFSGTKDATSALRLDVGRLESFLATEMRSTANIA
jgi:hypothetical protein